MKRTVEEDSDIDISSTESENEDHIVGDEDDKKEEEIVNVDFDFFDLNQEVDFHATKTFLTQLFGDDAQEFDISALADLILTKNSVGTTIKTDGKESDPFAILSVININNNATTPAVKKIVQYVLQKTSKQREFNIILRKLLSPDSKLKVGLIISERMINMPVEVVPPMYKMLLEEMDHAEDSHERYEFDYFLVISKVYKIVAAKVQDDQQKKKKKGGDDEEMDYFHFEDIVLEEKSKYHGSYDYTNKKQDSDSRRVFTEYGIEPMLSLILVDKNDMKFAVKGMEEKFPPY